MSRPVRAGSEITSPDDQEQRRERHYTIGMRTGSGMSIAASQWAKKVRTGAPGRKAVLLVLADYADELGSCFPGQKRIADETEMGERTVRRHLAELEQEGWIRREERRVDGYRTSDRIVLKLGREPRPANPTGSDDDPVLPANIDSPTGQNRPISPANPAGQGTVRGTARGTVSSRAASLEFDLPPAGRTYASARGHDVTFSAFWAVYPRKVAKAAARKAWDRAIRRAPDHVIIRGAQAYAADPNRELEFTAHPATWLNADRWEDDPLPARGRAMTRVGQSITAMAGTGQHTGVGAMFAGNNPRALGGGR